MGWLEDRMYMRCALPTLAFYNIDRADIEGDKATEEPKALNFAIWAPKRASKWRCDSLSLRSVAMNCCKDKPTMLLKEVLSGKCTFKSASSYLQTQWHFLRCLRICLWISTIEERKKDNWAVQFDKIIGVVLRQVFMKVSQPYGIFGVLQLVDISISPWNLFYVPLKTGAWWWGVVGVICWVHNYERMIYRSCWWKK